MMRIFGGKKEKSLGIDIGTSSIKMVELEKDKGKIRLANYAQYKNGGDSLLQSSSMRLLSSQVSDFIKEIIKEAKIETKEATMSIPMFSGFSTVIYLPKMSEDELEQAVAFEAKKYIPLPLSEVKFEWMPLGQQADKSQNLNSNSQTRILVVAVTNELINRYSKISQLSGLKLEYMELESFSLARALAKPDEPILIIDMGSRSTTITIIEGGWPIFTRTMDLSGLEFTKVAARSLAIDHSRAEELKEREGISSGDGVLVPLVDNILQEAKRILDKYAQKRQKSISAVCISGGSAKMPGLLEYVVKAIGKKTVMAEPFSGIIYPEELGGAIKELGPSFSVAVGLALRQLR